MYFHHYMIHFGTCNGRSGGPSTPRGHLRPLLRQQYWLGVIALVDGHARALLQPPPRVSSFGPTAGQAILLHVLELGALGALRNGR